MKNKNLKNLLIGAVVVVAGVSVTMYSCEKDNIAPTEEVTGEVQDLKSILPNPQGICSEVVKHKIVRNNKEKVGDAYMYNNAENFYMILFAEEGHFFRDAYLDLENSFESFPLNSDGNPAFTSFDYQITGKPLSNVRRFEIPIEKMNDAKYMSAVVQVRHTRYTDVKERAWVHGGRTYGDSQEGRIFIYNVEDCSTPDAEDGKTPPIDVPAEEVKTPKLPADK